LRDTCPSELAVKSKGKVIGCRSACDVFNTDEYCCRGLYGNPRVCQPTFYSKKFKEACPTAYSYAYDDPTSICTCAGTDYVITFCSSRLVNRTTTYIKIFSFFPIYYPWIYKSRRIPIRIR